MALTPGTRLGVYDITAQIGEGGMGQVYRARDTRLDRDVAIKILPEAFAHDADRLARFSREAKTLASLNHPHIAAIYGLEESAGVSALVMELVEGEDLTQRIARGPIPLNEALAIAKQIAEALEAAHEQGIVHRDLKPANVKMRPDGTVKVLDFGLAKLVADSPSVSVESDVGSESATVTTPAMMTGIGTILGTAAYMSPEQAHGKSVDKRADIWSFGCVLFEMIAGARAFAGDEVSETLAIIITKEPNWQALAPPAPAALRRLIFRCLRKDPRQRLRDVGDARLEIDALLRSGPEDSGMLPASAASPRWRRALPWALAGSLGAALVTMLPIKSPSQHTSAPTRITLSMSSDSSLTIEGSTAISPDGRTVAFAARSSQSSGLYIRRLDEWEPRALPLTDGATSPLFSPDGRWIAFSRNGVLEKIPVSGGSPQIICRTGNLVSNVSNGPFGGRWRDDGTIMFGTFPPGLWRVSSDGGTPEAIARPVDGSTAWYLWPEPLPGDRGILFTIWQGGRTSIAVVVPGTDKPRTLVESGGRQHYLPTGHLVYLADRRLFAVPFDVERLQVRGGATIVVEDVNEAAITSNYDVSINGTLIYQPADSSPYRIAWKDRQGRPAGVGTSARRYESLALSPDGERFSTTIYEGPTRSIWTGRAVNEPLTRLTFGNDDVFGLWSPDGSRLFYSVGQSNYNIFSTATDGSGQPERLTRSPHAQNATAVSPSGDTILFNDIDPSTKADIWELSLSRKESRPVVRTPFIEENAKFSPDGHWIAYESNESGQMEAYVQPYPGPGIKRRISAEGAMYPFWSHTGRELFYQTATAMFAIPILDPRDLRVGAPQRLFDNTRIGRAVISGDDQRFLILEKAEANQSAQLKLVENWFEELKTRVPTR